MTDRGWPSDAWPQPRGWQPTGAPAQPGQWAPGQGPPGAWGPPGPGFGSPYPAPVSTNRAAIVSLVAGCAQVVFCLIASIVAIVAGHSARRQIRESNGLQGGSGLATAGMTLGYVGLGLTVVVGLVIAFAVAFGDDLERSDLRDEARAFVRAAEIEARFTERGELRDPQLLGWVYDDLVDADQIDVDEMYLATGHALWNADRSDWERARWRIELRGEAIGDVYVCLTVPEAIGDRVTVTNGRCSP